MPSFESEKMYLKVHNLMEPIRRGVVDTVAQWSKLHPADFQLEPMRVLLTYVWDVIIFSSSSLTACAQQIHSASHGYGGCG